MMLLALAAVVWLVLHIGLAGTRLRDANVARLGDNGFRVLFSVLSIVALWLLVKAWQGAPSVPLWSLPASLQWILDAAMVVAAVLFVGSVTVPNPTAVGNAATLDNEPRGMVRVTRHPMLWSFALWGIVHMVANGDLASELFFGAFAVTALLGMPSIDAKLARRSPERWAKIAAVTSVVPFGAIASGRNRLVVGELLVPIVGGLVIWAGLVWLHPHLFGVAALPG